VQFDYESNNKAITQRYRVDNNYSIIRYMLMVKD